MTTEYRNPLPTVDVIAIIEQNDEAPEGAKIVLVKRKNPPLGWALPGGFVNEGESYEDAAVREAKEETGLDVELVHQLHTYSDPKRDPRRHITTTVYLAKAFGQTPVAGDDAGEVVVATVREALEGKYQLTFDHLTILKDALFFDTNHYHPSSKLLGSL